MKQLIFTATALIALLFVSRTAFAQSENGSVIDDPSQVSVSWKSLKDERLYLLEPSVGLMRGHWHTSSDRPTTTDDLFKPSSRDYNGLEFGVKLLTDSDTAHRFLIGFDLRELLAWDPTLVTDLRFGLRAEVRLGKWLPDLGASWFFGDLFRPVSRGMQFSGTSWALSLSKEWHVARWGIEYCFGEGAEGGGFIDRGAQGFHSIQTESWSVFAKFPLLIEY